MKDSLYPLTGSGGSFVAMTIGIIDVSGLLNALLFGVAGAIGGLIVKYSFKFLKQCLRKLRERSLAF